MYEARFLLAYLAVINLAALFAFGTDKLFSRSHRRRISEATLLALAAIGGSLGALLGMYLFHHKTRHRKFSLGVPLILVAQVIVLLLCSCKAHKAVRLPEQTSFHNKPLEHSPTTFIILYDADIGKTHILRSIKEYGASIIYDYHMMNGMAIRKPDDKTLEETMAFFRKVKGIISVEYDNIIRLTDPIRPHLEDR